MVVRNVLVMMFSLLLGSTAMAIDSPAADTAMDAVLQARSAEERARDAARHPAETLAFFQLAPGMTVAEVLPGEGWYTRILANYLGADGALYGVNYPDRLYPMFSFATDEWIAERIAGTEKFPEQVKGFTDNGIQARGFTLSTVPPELAGTVDRVLLVRALHNLNRFESQAGTRSQALAAVRSMLKDDGLVGVVQHRAPVTDDTSGTDGSRGYLNQAEVLLMFEQAGFELVATSEINANPLDQPAAEDNVWRLPPTLRTSVDDPKLRASMEAIGETDRMTLLFRKAPQVAPAATQ